MPFRKMEFTPNEQKAFLQKAKSLSANDLLKNLRFMSPSDRNSYVEKLYYVGILADIVMNLNASRRMQFYRLAKKGADERVDSCMKDAIRRAQMRGR